MPDGAIDAELTTLARDPSTKLFTKQTGFSTGAVVKKQSHVDGWHTDSSYEVSLPVTFVLHCGCAIHWRESGSRVELISVHRTFLRTTLSFT